MSGLANMDETRWVSERHSRKAFPELYQARRCSNSTLRKASSIWFPQILDNEYFHVLFITTDTSGGDTLGLLVHRSSVRSSPELDLLNCSTMNQQGPYWIHMLLLFLWMSWTVINLEAHLHQSQYLWHPASAQKCFRSLPLIKCDLMSLTFICTRFITHEAFLKLNGQAEFTALPLRLHGDFTNFHSQISSGGFISGLMGVRIMTGHHETFLSNETDKLLCVSLDKSKNRTNFW